MTVQIACLCQRYNEKPCWCCPNFSRNRFACGRRYCTAEPTLPLPHSCRFCSSAIEIWSFRHSFPGSSPPLISSPRNEGPT